MFEARLPNATANGSFRAIGEFTGPYEYAPRDDGGYFHRRAVNWLWSDRAGVPVEEIYAKRFSMRTLYMLTPSDLNMSALERYITSHEPGGPPEPFVLIIDEINRANISKVFGELMGIGHTPYSVVENPVFNDNNGPWIKMINDAVFGGDVAAAQAAAQKSAQDIIDQG